MTYINSDFRLPQWVEGDKRQGICSSAKTQAENRFALHGCLWTLRGGPSEIREGCEFHTEPADNWALVCHPARWHCFTTELFSHLLHGIVQDKTHTHTLQSHMMPRVVGMTSHDMCVFWHCIGRVKFKPLAWPVDWQWPDAKREKITISAFTDHWLKIKLDYVQYIDYNFIKPVR